MSIQLVIPMSGLGSRFVRVGFTDPKPLIKVHGRTMIEWVLKMFPGERHPLFICRREHIENTPMATILKELRPEGRIVAIEGAKLGPVDALMKAEDEIADDKPVLVSYCDYYMHWDYAGFRALVAAGTYGGAVPCYTGFHPHLLPAKNVYASCKVDDRGDLIEIREKHSFETDKTKSFHSPGLYYFQSGEILKKYSKKLMDQDDALNGEYYVSMVYNHLVNEGLRVAVPANVSRFCQWGTPEDLEDYLFWTGVARVRRA